MHSIPFTFKAIITFFLYGMMKGNLVYGDQVSTCSLVKGLALGSVDHLCGCLTSVCEPCNYIAYGSASVVCTNGCQYCAFGVCAEYFGSAIRDDETAIGLALVYAFGFSFSYTKGRSGAFAYSSTGITCNAFFNSVACSCQLNNCDASGTTTNAFIDCSNIQAGATADLCRPKDNYGIAKADHLLIGLLVDSYDPCNNPSPTSVPIKAPVKTPIKAPVKTPAKTPVKTPVKTPIIGNVNVKKLVVDATLLESDDFCQT